MTLNTIVLGIALITHHSVLVQSRLVLSQESSSEENTLEDILKQYKACSSGYCIPSNQCKNGMINTDGENLVDVRVDDYDEDLIDLEPEEHGSECQFMQTCCAFNNPRAGPPVPITTTTTTTTTAEPTLVVLPPSCGTNRPNGYVYRVKNSSVAQFAEFPWMVALLQRKELLGLEKLEYFCGGSLIHPKVILTAAHCVQRFANALDTLVVRLGEWDTVTENEPIVHQQYGVRKMIIHENYVDRKFHNDVALLIMEESAELNVHVNPICLPTNRENFDEQRCLVSGWGKENFNPEGKFSEVLKRVELPVVPRTRCKEMMRTTKLGPFFQLHRSFMCAGGETGVDTCKGDGGSPLACKQGNLYTQAGIVAWGVGCGETNVPGAYVKVAYFVDWIQEKLEEENIQISER